MASWTFGSTRPGATVRNKAQLDQAFRYRFMYEHGRLVLRTNCWPVYCDYSPPDRRSLHVFENDASVLKSRGPRGGGPRPGGIESNMPRALLPVTPGMVVEMRAKVLHDLGTWPAFWLNPGVEYPGARFSAIPWPPEIDIFEFFEWLERDHPRLMESHAQTAGDPAKYENPTDLFSLYGRHSSDPGIDFSADFHISALDWQEDAPVWLLDGRRIKQARYVWDAPPAHILLTNQIGLQLNGVTLSGMRIDEPGWDYRGQWLRRRWALLVRSARSDEMAESGLVRAGAGCQGRLRRLTT